MKNSDKKSNAMEIHNDDVFNGRYRLIEKRGSGSFGEVWLARDEQLDMEVAVKIYVALDDRGIDEFKSEYKTAYKLNHPNLLHAYHFDICGRRPFLVMPYCPDSTVAMIGNINPETVWKFIHDVASGLAYLHEMDIVHHDIKPDNVLVTEDSSFVITDFGISIKMRSTLRRNSSRAVNSSGGSLPYMAPEMFSSMPESVKATDIWALGASLYELIVGELPFFGQGGALQLNGASIPELPETCPPELKRVVRACLKKDAWERPTAMELVTYSEAILNGKKPFAPWRTRDTASKRIDEDKVVNDATVPVERIKATGGFPGNNVNKIMKYVVSGTVAVLAVVLIVLIAGTRIEVTGKNVVTSAGETVDYSVTKNRSSYSVRNLPAWAKLDMKTDEGFRLVFVPDAQGGERGAEIKVSSFGKSRILKIVQRPVATFLDVKETRARFSNAGGTKDITIRTDGTVDVMGLPVWLKAQKEGNKMKLVCDRNDSEDLRSASVEFRAGDYKDVVEVTQSGKSLTTFLKIDGMTSVASVYPVMEGKQTYSVSTDGKSYKVTNLPEWCTLSDRKADSFVIRYEKNDGGDREADFKVVSGDKVVTISVKQLAFEQLPDNEPEIVSEPFAEIDNIDVDYNARHNMHPGIRINVKFRTRNMASHKGQIAAFFFNSSGSKLMDGNSNYVASDGQVCTGESFMPAENDSAYESFSLFIPHDELHIVKSGTQELSFDVEIQDLTNGVQLARSNRYYFQITY